MHAVAFREKGLVVYGAHTLDKSPTAVWLARATKMQETSGSC